jgi:subtilisin family serine protease
MRRRIVVILFVGFVLYGCGWKFGGNQQPSNPKFITYKDSDVKVIPGDYLVVFDSTKVPEALVEPLAKSLVVGTSGKIEYVFTKTIRACRVKNLNDVWATAVSGRPDVSLVRKDFEIWGKELRGGPFEPVPWNLDRVDQRAPFRLDRDYRLKTGPVGVTPPVPIYVLDNGVYRDHREFASDSSGSRVEDVFDVMNTHFARCSLSVADGNHGTRVASIAAGVKFGITPTLIKNVKVLDKDPLGSSCVWGTPSTVLTGLEETKKHMLKNKTTKAIVNLSLGWYASTPDVDTAILDLQNLGAIVVAAGGNENQDAAGLTPAKLPGVMAVGATDKSDARLVFSSINASNFGSTIALWAPGFEIKAADWQLVPDPTATSFASGTSDAAPHVAGAAALIWQQHPSMSAAQVMTELRSRATLYMLTNLGPVPRMLCFMSVRMLQCRDKRI